MENDLDTPAGTVFTRTYSGIAVDGSGDPGAAACRVLVAAATT